jgi:hypothetical protein
VAKINSSGNGLIYSSIIGGDSFDVPFALVGDSQGNVYVAGVTTSEDFPTMSAYNATSNGVSQGGSNDGIVFCLNSTGNGLIFSTFIGGEGSEGFYDIELDPDNDVWVCGYTESNDFPLIDNIQGNQHDTDGILFELSSNGSALLFSTYLGGSGHDVCYSLKMDERENVFIAGYTSSDDFPVFRLQQFFYNHIYDFVYDGFVMKIDPKKSIQYSTLVGGSSSDSCRSLVVGRSGAVFVGGTTGSDDFPLRHELSGPSIDITGSIDGFAVVFLDISDEDGDGFPSWWEMVKGFNPLDSNAPLSEILIWYAPVILTAGAATTLLVIILVFGRHRIKAMLGRTTSN